MRYTVILRHVVNGTWERAEFVLARFRTCADAIGFCFKASPLDGHLLVVDSLERETVWEG